MDITNWEDVNKGLRRMGELVIKKAVAAARLQEKVNAAQENYDHVRIPAEEEYKALESQIKAFAAANKAAFVGKSRTKKLSFGSVNWKLTNGKVVLELQEDIVIMNLRQQGHEDCIRMVEEIDKDAVQNLDDRELLKAGIKVKKDDVCHVKPDVKKVQEALQPAAQEVGA